MEQQDSATLLLKSGKSLLQVHEAENYYKETWETKSDISKYMCITIVCLPGCGVIEFEINRKA